MGKFKQHKLLGVSVFLKLIFQILFTLVFFSASDAYSCGCAKPQKIEETVNASHIFKGRVIKIQPLRAKYSEGERVTITFRILEMIKGTYLKEIEVEFTNAGFSSCDLEEISFQLGDVYLMSTFEYSEPKGKYLNNYCCLRQKLER